MKASANPRVFRVFALSACLLFAVTHHACAEDSVPIPPKRPAVLKASKAYVEELRARLEQNNSQSAREIVSDPVPQEESIISVPAAPVQENELSAQEPEPIEEESLETKLHNPSPEQVVSALEGNPIKMIVPPKKPAIPIKNIEPAAGEPDEEPQADTQETPSKSPEKPKLVSFYLEPAQTKLDEGLSVFLRDHALKILTDDKDMDIEIYSYATSLEGEDHSDVRISLARALEVRSFLMGNRIDAARLKLKPMTNYDKKNQGDRIDLVFVRRS